MGTHAIAFLLYFSVCVLYFNKYLLKKENEPCFGHCHLQDTTALLCSFSARCLVIQQQALSAPVPKSGRQARSEAKVITKKFSNQETSLNTGQSMRGEGVGITQSGCE